MRISRVLPFCLVLFLLLAEAAPLVAGGTLIAVPQRRDHVFDAHSDILFISTSDGCIERYDVSAGSLLAPFDVGNELNGLDVTPDGTALYTAEAVRGATQGFFRKVDLPGGAVTNLTYDLDFGEGGAWDVGIADNGLALASTQFEGSGWVPLRQIDLSDDTLSVRGDAPGSGFGGEVRQNTKISSSADRSFFFLTESNISSGPIFTYDAGSDTFPDDGTTGSFHGSPTAVNRDGTRLALRLGSNIAILDENLNSVETLVGFNGGMIFDPVRTLFYAVDSSADEIVVFDARNWSEIDGFPVGENVGSSSAFDTGVMSMSDDGLLLFLSTPSGVRMYDVRGIACREGVVNAATGPVDQVLLVNGSAGGMDRVVTVGIGQPITVNLLSSSAGPDGSYVLWAWIGPPSNARDLLFGGESLGCTVNPTPLELAESPQPFRCVPAPSIPAGACSGIPVIGGPASTPFSVNSGGFGNAATFVLQAAIRDDGSAHPSRFSVTNSVTLEIE